MTATQQRPAPAPDFTSPAPPHGIHLSRRFAGRLRVWLIFRGLLGLALGGIILFRPEVSVEAFALLIGVFFCVIGVARIVVGAADSEFTVGIRVLNVVFGLILVGLGAVSIRHPAFGLLTTVMIIGFAWMMEGGATLAVLPPKHQGRAWAITFAVISLLVGALVIMWPVASVLPLMIVVGAFLVAGGVVDIVNAVLLKPTDRPRPME
jgi:hypothetical protein